MLESAYGATCAEPGCEERTHGRGLCCRHYLRAKRAGSLPPIRRPETQARKYLATARDVELAYLAGLIDGEGCVSLHGRRDPARGYCTAALQIANTYLPMLERLHDLLGGTVYTGRSRTGHKPCWVWGIFAAGARDILLAVRPYLRVKAAQADVVLGLDWTQPGRAGLPPETRMARQAAMAEIRRLNRRGARAA